MYATIREKGETPVHPFLLASKENKNAYFFLSFSSSLFNGSAVSRSVIYKKSKVRKSKDKTEGQIAHF